MLILQKMEEPPAEAGLVLSWHGRPHQAHCMLHGRRVAVGARFVHKLVAPALVDNIGALLSSALLFPQTENFDGH